MGTLAKKGKWIGLCVLLASGLVAGGALVVQANESTPATKLIQHDSVTLFKGLVLRTGPVAQIVYPGQALGETTSPTAREFERNLIREIRRSEPGFFARFGAAVTSGDHVQVARAIDYSRDVVRPAFAKLVDADLADLAAASSEKGLHPLHEYTNTYVHVQENVNVDWQVSQDTNIATNFVLALNLWLVVNPTEINHDNGDSSYSLERDLLVARVVKLLSTH